MNPTNDVLEKRLSALEGGLASLTVSSGQTASTFAILNVAQACATFKIAKVDAVCPDETVRLARPPSSADNLFSRTSLVGFMIRV